MLAVTLKELKVIWNTKPLLAAADRATGKTLDKFGGYVKKTSKNSIKTKPEGVVSQPGHPPFGHRSRGKTRNYKDWIFSFTDKTRKEVVIGAIRLPRKDNAIVPGALEYGGPSMGRKHRRWGLSKVIPIQVAERPHMRPAYTIAVNKLLPELLRNSIVP